jgi:hypothetical protein
MSGFQLDTSGHVLAIGDGGHPYEIYWSDLDPFTQGYIEAMAKDLGLQYWGDGESDDTPAYMDFVDLAPETLARIIADCEAFNAQHAWHNNKESGACWWHNRQIGQRDGQAGHWASRGFPPLTPTLGEDGEVQFAEARS